MKTRGGHTRPEPPVALPSSISPRLRDILARSRITSRGRSGDGGGAEGHDPPLHVLSEDKYGEVVLERLQEEVEFARVPGAGRGEVEAVDLWVEV